MKLSIKHKTSYRYSEKVPLNPHQLFLIPQQRTYYSILSADWVVSPDPSGRSQRINAEGNPFFQVWFDEETDLLEVTVNIQLETREFNPYAFILSPEFTYPFEKFKYRGKTGMFLSNYITSEEFQELRKFGMEVMEASSDIVTFLVNLATRLYKEWSHSLRYEPGLLHPMETFHNREGSCRDLSWMLMNVLGNVGLASRFVSGYAYNPELEEGHELHGWIEVYLPGAGWVGVDPSLGLFTDHHYIPLASSFHPTNTLPIAGTYGGTAKSEFFTEVMIQEV